MRAVYHSFHNEKRANMDDFYTKDLKSAVRDWLMHNMVCTVKQIGNLINKSIDQVYKYAKSDGESKRNLTFHQFYLITKCGDYRLLDYIENECGRVARAKHKGGYVEANNGGMGLNACMSRINEGMMRASNNVFDSGDVSELVKDIVKAQQHLYMLEDHYGELISANNNFVKSFRS